MKKTKEGNFLEEVAWEIKVPIFKNRIIVKQLFIGIGIPFGIITIIMLINKAYYGVLLIALTLLFTFILVMLIFKGTYDIHFVINQKGILCENQPNQAKRVRRLSALTVFLGFFARNSTVAGAGMLSGDRTKVFIPWKRIRKVKYLVKQKCIILYGGFCDNIAVFCSDENYYRIKLIIVEKTGAEEL